MNTLRFVESLVRDVRYALRTMRAKPSFTVSALLSLALGIGANIAIFSVVNAVLIRPLPYPDSGKLVGVYNSAVFSGQVFRDWPLSLDLYSAYKQGARSFQEFGVWTAGEVALTGLGDPEQIPAVWMTHGVLRALGAHPFLGRWFSSADELLGARRTVILSYAYWQQRFGGDPHVLNRLVLIDSVPHQVIGVMPRNFVFLDLAPDVLVPQLVGNDAPGAQDADHNGLARLKPGVTLAQANQDIARVLHIWGGAAGTEQVLKQLRVRPNVHPLKQDVVGDVGSILEILMGALGLVLLLVCANVANLVQVRAQSRSQEFAIRAALGAGRGRIARELLVENFTLGALGGAIGLGLAYIGLRLLVAHGPANLPRIVEISIDSTGLLFALGASVASSVLFGFITVLKSGLSTRVQNARGASPGREQSRAQNALVVTQVALALVLLIGAGLLLRSFFALRSVKPGFTHPEQVQTVRLFIPEAQVPEPERVAQMQADILHNLSAIPGVTAVAFATALPLQPEYHNGNPVFVEGQTPVDRIPPNRTIKDASPGLFAALGARLIAGRDFTWADLLGRHRVAIVSENMARENWRDPRDAIGKRIRIGNGGPWSVVVGVAENVYDDGMDRQPPTLVYFPAGVRPPYQPGAAPGVRRSVAFAIRSKRAGTEGLLKEMAAAIHSVDSSLPLARVQTLIDLYRLSMARASFALVLLGIAALMALTLAIVGVYGILAYSVAQRRREISIRVALGAEPLMVKVLFLRQGLILTCLGGAIGLIFARGLSHWLSSLLFGITPADPLTYGAAGALILAAAMSASYIPVQRAASLDPMEALRSE
jgi:putative ABC transport system permease protein